MVHLTTMRLSRRPASPLARALLAALLVQTAAMAQSAPPRIDVSKLGPQKDDPAVKEETQNYVSAVGVNPIMKGTWGSWCIGGVSQVRH